METEPPVETKPKTAYDYEFDINAIRADCIAIGQGMGYTLNTSLTPQNATWWNPVTASESNQGSTLKSALEQYIRFHTVSNLGAYGLDEITEFNICCESRGSGSYYLLRIRITTTKYGTKSSAEKAEGFFLYQNERNEIRDECYSQIQEHETAFGTSGRSHDRCDASHERIRMVC